MEQIDSKTSNDSSEIVSAVSNCPIREQTKPRGPRRWNSLWISATFHMLLIGLLAIWYFPKSDSRPVAENSAKQASAIASPKALASPTDSNIPPTPANVPSETIQTSLKSTIEATTSRSDEKNLQSLDQNLDRAQRVVKPESISELVETVADSMNIDSTMYADKSPIAGTKFDPNTAQLTSVERKATADGNWSYEGLMVDRNGNRSRVPMTPAEGATAYEAFEKIKSMPMAAALYQQLVMPLMQQMVAPENSRPPGNIVIAPANGTGTTTQTSEN